jgi:hypothetical protein
MWRVSQSQVKVHFCEGREQILKAKYIKERNWAFTSDTRQYEIGWYAGLTSLYQLQKLFQAKWDGRMIKCAVNWKGLVMAYFKTLPHLHRGKPWKTSSRKVKAPTKTQIRHLSCTNKSHYFLHQTTLYVQYTQLE